jgi:hypothetical protein
MKVVIILLLSSIIIAIFCHLSSTRIAWSSKRRNCEIACCDGLLKFHMFYHYAKGSNPCPKAWALDSWSFHTQFSPSSGVLAHRLSIQYWSSAPVLSWRNDWWVGKWPRRVDIVAEMWIFPAILILVCGLLLRKHLADARRRKRLASGLCINCGYPMEDKSKSNRCSECGEVPTSG